MRKAQEQVEVTPQGRGQAKRQLNEWMQRGEAVDDTESSIRLFLAIKSLLPPKARLTPALFHGVKTQAWSTSSLARPVWIVMKELLPELPVEVKPYIIQPEEMETSSLPDGLTADTCWFVDQGAERSKLGKGVLVHTVTMGTTRSVRVNLPTGQQRAASSEQVTPAAPVPAVASTVPDTSAKNTSQSTEALRVEP